MRNTFEEQAAKLLGTKYQYEAIKLSYTLKPAKYTPDFIDPVKKILIETKGFWRNADRAKMKLIRDQYPDWTIIMVFQKHTITINKTTKTTYADWCDKNNILWATIDTLPTLLKKL